jgi:hypothetical protein
LNVPDSEFVPLGYQRTVDVVRRELAEGETFFTFTSEASWYYLVHKASPVRFPVIWFAMPRYYQEEVVKDLASANVKLVLYRNAHWANRIDGFTSQERLPLVNKYILEHFTPYQVIDGNELWIRRRG